MTPLSLPVTRMLWTEPFSLKRKLHSLLQGPGPTVRLGDHGLSEPGSTLGTIWLTSSPQGQPPQLTPEDSEAQGGDFTCLESQSLTCQVQD